MKTTLPATNFLINASKSTLQGLSQARKFYLTLLGILIAMAGMAQTFTTKAKGDWTNPNTWVGGIAPTRLIAVGTTVNIRHEVRVNITDDIQIFGTVNITGDTLRFPATFTKKTYINTTGTLRVLNGGFLQDISVNQSDVEVKGGKIFAENATVHIGKNFKNNEGHRSFRNSLIKVGENFEADGSSYAVACDTLQYSTLEVNLSHSGHLDLKDDSRLRVANARIIAHDGDFKTAGKTSIVTLPGTAAGGYGFDLIKTSSHLDVDGGWDAKIYTHCVNGDIKGGMAAGIDFVRAEDCTLAPPPPPSPAAQLVMNEIYPDPDANSQEFFELYNMSSNPESVDNYTLVTFFNENNVNGFYVLDFPNLTIAPRSFFVGTSAFPFSYQGLSPSTLASMNWNKLSTDHDGRLQKWILSSDNNKADGNQYYNLAPLPAAGLNDLFHRFTGDNAFTFFVYKNGVLVNRVIAGAGGRKTLSDAVTSMPRLQVDMLGTAPDFSIDFNKYVNLPVENIIPDVGTDNGFIRTVDGGCGTWRKGSTASRHTPMESNGGILTNTGGDLNIVASISNGTPTTGSTLNFSALGAATLFPAELRVFVDNGSMPFQFDVDDQLVSIATATLSGQSLTQKFTPYDANVFIVAKQGTGCIDQVMMISRSDARYNVLPLRFTAIDAAYNTGSVGVAWTTQEEEKVQQFVVQRSTNGQLFNDIGVISPSGPSYGSYRFQDNDVAAAIPVYYYRIKAECSNGTFSYSSTKAVKLQAAGTTVTVFPNPVTDKLTITMPVKWKDKTARYELFNANGSLLQAGTITTNQSVIDMKNRSRGMYLLNVTSGTESSQQRLIKN